MNSRSIMTSRKNFNPLPPHGGRPDNWDADQMEMFISIHSLRMEGDSPVGGWETLIDISIHSLRMEGDTVGISLTQKLCISIHSLRMEGDIGIPTP